MKVKFKKGDKVRVTKRATQYAIEGLRNRTRTVVKVSYDERWRCSLYDLGARGKGINGYLFRSFMLAPVNGQQRHTIGRPRGKLLLAPPNQSLAEAVVK